MTRFLVCPACGHHDPSAGAAGGDNAGDASDASDDGNDGGEGDAGGGDDRRRDGAPTDDEETPDCPRCGSRRTYRHDDPTLPDAETEAYVKFDADSVGER
jgi:DNA-directed RNA polymerase subunit RPC12/RpoP